MESPPPDDVFPESLKDAVHKGKLIPFAGAGVSMGVRRHDGTRAFANWTEFLLAGADQLDAEKKGQEAKRVRELVKAKPPDLVQAAQQIHDGLKPHGWVKFLR